MVAAVTFAGLWITSRSAPERLARLSIVPPQGMTLSDMTLSGGDTLAISPDGSRIVFGALDESGVDRLFLRAVDDLEPRAVAGSEGASGPFWSPDGAHLAFFVDQKLKRVAASGGSPQTICDAPGPRGGSWGPEGSIVFSGGGSGGRGALQRVPAGGGTPTTLTSLDEKGVEFSHSWPFFLPDGKHVLFARQTGEGGVEGDESTIEVLSLESGERTTVLRANSSVQYVPSGHILF